MKKVKLEYMLIHEDAVLPSKKRQEDAGYDIYTVEDGVIPPARSADEPGMRNFRTGVRIACPLGYFLSIRGRSGLGFKGVSPFIGTLDATYNGELRVLLINESPEPVQVNKGDRIAQLVIEEQIEMEPVEVEEFSPEYDKRGVDGFGSSGR